MNLLDYRNAIAADLKANIAAAKTVATHRGQFASVDEVNRYAVKAPAVLVALLDAAGMPIGSAMLRCTCRVGIYVMTKDAPNAPRDDTAIGIVNAVLLRAITSDWGADATTPANLRAQNLYRGDIDKQGICLFAVSFDQVVTIEYTLADGLAEPFETFHQDIDAAPANGAIDISQTTELPQ